MTPPPFLFLSLRNGLANPSIENWPNGKEESSFVSVTTKTSTLFLSICLSCSNLLFIVFMFKLPKTSLLEFLIFKFLSESERLLELFGVSNDCFKSYLSNRNQYVSINGFDSGLAAINCGIPQGSVLGPLLFLLYINDLNHTTKFCKIHHFADDTNLLCMSNSIKKLNKLVNADLKHLVYWLNANKISLNVKKTEMVIFKSKQKKFEGDLKIKLCGKRLYPSESVKYLGVKIDTNLNWEHHVNDLSIKLNRANALLFKMRKYVSLKILRSIYFAIFDSYLSYCCLVWAQNSSTIQQIVILQKKAVRIINFQPRNSHTSPLFKQSSILKFQDKICLENILFVSKSLNNLSPSVFNTWFVWFLRST